MDMDYDRMRYEILIMELVKYNTAIGMNVMNVDDIEDFQICSGINM